MLLLMKILVFANFSLSFKTLYFLLLSIPSENYRIHYGKINRKDLVTFNTERFVVLRIQNLQNLLQFVGIETIMS